MAHDTELEQALARVELRLAALGEALRMHDADAVAGEAVALQRALAAAMEPLRHGARGGALPPPLRERLALARGRVAAQHESLARASAALARALDVLLRAAAPRAGYSAAGQNERPAHAGVMLA